MSKKKTLTPAECEYIQRHPGISDEELAMGIGRSLAGLEAEIETIRNNKSAIVDPFVLVTAGGNKKAGTYAYTAALSARDDGTGHADGQFTRTKPGGNVNPKLRKDIEIRDVS